MMKANGRSVWRDLRCGGKDCGRQLARGYLMTGSRLELRCPKCGRMNAFRLVGGALEELALDTPGKTGTISATE
jgi:phage FluMu protein Com